MLTALGNRADRRQAWIANFSRNSRGQAPADAFHLYRQARSQRARTLNALLIPLNDDYSIPLRRAPDIRQACVEAYGPAETASVTSLRALLGVIGAHEWRTKGIELPEAGGRIHPHFGVFAPIRREYVDLIATTPLPARALQQALLSISARAPVCSPRYLHGVASNAWSRPISIHARWRVRVRTFDSSGSRNASMSCRRIFFPKVARRSWSATRHGFPRGRARPWKTESTIPKAGCCADFWRSCRSTWSRAVRGG